MEFELVTLLKSLVSDWVERQEVKSLEERWISNAVVLIGWSAYTLAYADDPLTTTAFEIHHSKLLTSAFH